MKFLLSRPSPYQCCFCGSNAHLSQACKWRLPPPDPLRRPPPKPKD